MKYQILLSDCKSGREALIECQSDIVLEELSTKIKVEMQLPYTDNGYHRFLLRGKTYVIEEHLISEPEMRWEATGFYDDFYRSSENIRLDQCFTVIGSAITYFQDEQDGCGGHNTYKVRCVLVARV